jgi:hypothetical protein
MLRFCVYCSPPPSRPAASFPSTRMRPGRSEPWAGIQHAVFRNLRLLEQHADAFFVFGQYSSSRKRQVSRQYSSGKTNIAVPKEVLNFHMLYKSAKRPFSIMLPLHRITSCKWCPGGMKLRFHGNFRATRFSDQACLSRSNSYSLHSVGCP